MKPLLIRNGRIVDPGQDMDRVASLLIEGDRITAVGDVPPPAGSDVLDAAGLVVCPGFIDMHCHLREPGGEEKETIATGTRAAARGGFTTVCCMPNTNPPLDSVASVDYVKSVAAAQAVIRVRPIGCVTEGRRGRRLAPLAALAAAGAVAFSDDGEPVTSAGLLRRALEQAKDLDRPIIDHCEDKGITAGGIINEGVISKRLGVKGMPREAEESIVARDIEIAAKTGGRLHIAHVSTTGSADLIRQAKETGVSVTAEATPHHLTLTEERASGLDTNAKVNPPLRTEADRAALVAALGDGTIDAVATDHAPHTEADKRLPFAAAPFGISGLETAFGSLMGLVHAGQLSLGVLIARLTSGPARIIGQASALAVGAPAGIAILDPDREWVVDPAAFASKGRNTPLAGAMLRGKVMATIFGGKLVYADPTMVIKTAGPDRPAATLSPVSPSPEGEGEGKKT